MAVQKAGEELLTYPAIFRPIVVHFLKSYRQLRSSASVARRLLLPELEKRIKKTNEKTEYQDMLQWLVDTAQGRDADPERLMKMMLFLNMAAIHTTAMTATNVFLDLCARPECIDMIREEILQVLKEDGGIKASTLQKLKKLDSFMRESRRMNSMGFCKDLPVHRNSNKGKKTDLFLSVTFQRRLMVPLTLSNRSTIPARSYISIAYQPLLTDPTYYPSPLTFDPLRFYNLRQKEGEEEKHQFASVDSSDLLWTFGKFACPGRHWATAQIKLLVMVLLMEFDVSFPEGQRERPENKVVGTKCMPSVTQKMVLRRRVS
jgi:cytochrome P450